MIPSIPHYSSFEIFCHLFDNKATNKHKLFFSMKVRYEKF